MFVPHPHYLFDTDFYVSLLQVLRAQYHKEQAQAHATVQTQFNYAWGLVKSPVRNHQVKGVQLLQGTGPFNFSFLPT